MTPSRPRSMSHFRSLLTIAGVIGLIPSPTSATTQRVPAGAPTIRDAILLCAAGDTVLVAPGVYTGDGNRNLSFGGLDLVLRGEAGAEQTILDGQALPGEQFRCIAFNQGESRAAVLEGFTIRGFQECEGSAVFIDQSSPTIRDCILASNLMYALGNTHCGGLGVCVLGPAEPLIERCVIRENGWAGEGGGEGGGIAVLRSASPIFRDCHIIQNGADVGAVFVDGATLTMEGCEVRGNFDTGITTGSYWTTTVLRHCLIQGNYGAYGGGVALGGQGTIEGCTIAENRASYRGGGAVFYRAGFTMVNTIVWGNCAPIRPEVTVTPGVTITCCAIPDAGVVDFEGNVIMPEGPQVHADPRFCDPVGCPVLWPLESGDYHLQSGSPCLPENNSCGVLIGALDTGCGGPGPDGACCLASGECIVRTSEGCAEAGGLFEGAGTTCTPNPCPVIPVDRTTWGQITARFR